jgi:antagonist of KipI
MSLIEVLQPGLLTTVQDVVGRRGALRYGVPAGGALDLHAAAAANRLVGNPTATAVLEITLVGPELRFVGTSAFALAGADLAATLDTQPVPTGWSWLARPGSVLRFGRAQVGVRAYLAVAGGFDLPLVLGSPSTYLRAEAVFPDLAGRALQAGDCLAYPDVRDAQAHAGRYLAAASATVDPLASVRVLPGPDSGRFSAETIDRLCDAEWTIGPLADRMGYRLLGPTLEHLRGADVTSTGLPLGAIQVPGNGAPIVLLADRQPTGGYTVLGCVITADIGLLAQRTSGDGVHFALTTPADAIAALRTQRASLEAVESL